MRCSATKKKDGQRCKLPALLAGDRCFWHAEGEAFDSLRQDALHRAGILGRLSQQADVKALDAALGAAGWPDHLRKYVIRRYLRGSVAEGGEVDESVDALAGSAR